jgi:haloacetate dehalogenase
VMPRPVILRLNLPSRPNGLRMTSSLQRVSKCSHALRRSRRILALSAASQPQGFFAALRMTRTTASFFVAGHDRGGRCAYRMALDHPERVLKLAVLDIIPTGEAFRRADMAFGLGYWHWFFLAQPYDLPERLIGADPEGSFRSRPVDAFAPAALENYLRCFRNPATIHAMCEDYRAGAGIDFQLDEADRGRVRIRCPVLALWAKRGPLQRWYDVLDIWRTWADDVHGHAIDSGHYLAEEAPDETYEALHAFLTT